VLPPHTADEEAHVLEESDRPRPANLTEIAADEAPAPIPERPESWLVHTPDSWARAFLATFLRFHDPEALITRMDVTLQTHRRPDGSMRVSLAWGEGPSQESFRLTLRP
jgi:hypothetical protein